MLNKILLSTVLLFSATVEAQPLLTDYETDKIQSSKIHTPHAYTEYEKKVLNNVKQFHVNYNNHDYKKNGDLVTSDINIRFNGVNLKGRSAFVDVIQKSADYFPDIKLQDIRTFVDGNVAVIEFVATGTLKKDLQTPYGIAKANNQKIKVEFVEIFTFDKNAKLQDLITIQRVDQLYDQLLNPKSSN